jgi:hypothetical protein
VLDIAQVAGGVDLVQAGVGKLWQVANVMQPFGGSLNRVVATNG